MKPGQRLIRAILIGVGVFLLFAICTGGTGEKTSAPPAQPAASATAKAAATKKSAPRAAAQRSSKDTAAAEK